MLELLQAVVSLLDTKFALTCVCICSYVVVCFLIISFFDSKGG